MKKPKLLVVGSFVMDLIVSTEIFPSSGETVLGKKFQTAPGGKGANQAVQAANLGAEVAMVGRVGDDAFGKELTGSAKAAGIDVSHVEISRKESSAIGNILLEVESGKKSRNRIIVVPGANMEIRLEDLEFLREEIGNYDMVLLQLEIPMEINELVAEMACEKGVPVMLNSAPYAPLSEKLLRCVTYISPNEHEAALLTGIPIRSGKDGVNREDVEMAVRALQEKGVKNVIITLGSNGAVVSHGEESFYMPCVDIVEVKDPTAAGDSFVGAFCTAICAGLAPQEALAFANYTATLTVSRMGAQPSLPTLQEVISLMRQDNFTGFDLSRLNVLC